MTLSDITAGHSASAPVRRSAPSAPAHSCVSAPAPIGAAHTQHNADRAANWPADRRDLWRAEEIIGRVFPGAVVISEHEPTR
jgi:hypothetical protein